MWGKFLSGRPHPLPWPKFLVTRLLTRDLFILQLTVVLFNSFSLILCLIAYTVHCNKIVKFSVRLLVICIKSAVELAATATFRQLLCFYFSRYAILCIMSCRQCLFQRYCSYATIVLCIHHCKWVAHDNLSINGDDDDDDDESNDDDWHKENLRAQNTAGVDEIEESEFSPKRCVESSTLSNQQQNTDKCTTAFIVSHNVVSRIPDAMQPMVHGPPGTDLSTTCAGNHEMPGSLVHIRDHRRLLTAGWMNDCCTLYCCGLLPVLSIARFPFGTVVFTASKHRLSK